MVFGACCVARCPVAYRPCSPARPSSSCRSSGSCPRSWWPFFSSWLLCRQPGPTVQPASGDRQPRLHPARRESADRVAAPSALAPWEVWHDRCTASSFLASGYSPMDYPARHSRPPAAATHLRPPSGSRVQPARYFAEPGRSGSFPSCRVSQMPERQAVPSCQSPLAVARLPLSAGSARRCRLGCGRWRRRSGFLTDSVSSRGTGYAPPSSSSCVEGGTYALKVIFGCFSARTRRAVFVSGLDVNRGLVAQLGQIRAHRRFHLAHEVVLLNFLFNVFELRNAARNMLNYLQNYESLLGANWLGVLAGL